MGLKVSPKVSPKVSLRAGASHPLGLNDAHHQLVEREVRRVLLSLNGAFDEDDARSGAYEGLVEAMQRFNPRHGVPFERFARPTVRGAILDSLREITPFGRAGYAQLRAIYRAHVLAQQRALEPPSTPPPTPSPKPLSVSRAHEDSSSASHQVNDESSPASAALDEAVEVSFQHLKDLALSLCLEAFERPSEDLERALEEEEERDAQRAQLSEAFEQLSSQDQELLVMVYDLRAQGTSAADYARLYEVTPSAVSHKHQRVLERLRRVISTLDSG